MAGRIGHQKKQEILVKECPSCGEKMKIVLSPTAWKKQALKSWWECSCGQKRIRVRGSGHKVV